MSWLNSSFLGNDDRGFMEDGVKTYQMAPMSPLNSPTVFSIVASVVDDDSTGTAHISWALGSTMNWEDRSSLHEVIK
jgi:hypothetical protein